MTDLDTIFDDEWNTGNVSKPAIVREEYLPLEIHNRAVSVKLVRKNEDYMGILSRDKYTPESHDAWAVRVCSSTQSDAIDIINETRRICATYAPTDEEKFLTWELGDWETILPHRWEFRFIVMARKSGMDMS